MPDQRAEARFKLIAILTHMRPERTAGGFPHDDDTVEFYGRVNALITPCMTVLDYGAGRGRQFDLPDPGYAQTLQRLQGKVAKVIGLDIHEGIRQHPYLDERHVVSPEEPLPIPSGSIDLVVADWVFEHIEMPVLFAQEMERVIAPGGWICARTVNKWGYVGIGARLIPKQVHGRLLRELMPHARPDDAFPTHYRLNSLADIRRFFPPANWQDCSYLVNPTPRYFASSRALFTLTDVLQKLMPYGLRTDLLVFLRRKRVRQ